MLAWQYCNKFLTLLILVIATPCFAKAQNQDATLVTTKNVDDVIIYPLGEVPAQAISLNNSILSSEIKGKIVTAPKKVGTSVAKEEIISVLECSDYEHELTRVRAEKLSIEADLKLTTWQLERTKKLIASDHASQELLQKQAAKVESLRANLVLQESRIKLAKNIIERCNIKAPFAGIITKRFINVGEYATSGTKIVQLLDTTNLELEARLHKNEILQLNKAEEIQFKTSTASYPVNIRTIIPDQDPKYRTQIVRLNFLEKTPLPGAAGRLIWKSIDPAIPAEYIRQYNRHLGFFIAESNTAKFISLDNAIEGQPALLKQKPNSDIIIDGRFVVEDGSKIKIQKKLAN